MTLAVDAVLTSPPTWAGPAAADIEAAGYDGLVVPEAAHDAFVTLTVAAGTTTQVRVGSSIAIAFGRTPMVTAYAAHDLQELSGGRFTLGLGPQIKPHIENRYGMPWSKPAARMREYVEAVRAIWASWATGDRLDFRGDFYEHTLMTPMFSPGAFTDGPPPIHVAAVGPRMTAVAAEVADGLIVHPMATADHIASVTKPALTGSPRDVSVVAWCMVGCGHDDESLAESRELTRAQIGFYGSTPAYRPLLDHHGDGDLQPELRRLSKAGDWAAMTTAIDDTIVGRYAIVGEPSEVADEVLRRYEGVADRVCLAFMSADPDRVAPAVLERIHDKRAAT